MLTRPRIADRSIQPYVALRRRVAIPFGATVEVTVPQLFGWLERHGIEPAGPLFFKYNVIDMARELEIDFGVTLPEPLAVPDDMVVTGELPAGRYATLTHHGHYQGLVEATGSLLDWIGQHGLAPDMTPSERGDRFAGRFEIYTNDPQDIADPTDWETEIWVKLRQGKERY